MFKGKNERRRNRCCRVKRHDEMVVEEESGREGVDWWGGCDSEKFLGTSRILILQFLVGI